MLEDRRVKLDIDLGAKMWLADLGYDPNYGARPLRRLIQRSLIAPLSKMILHGEGFP